MPMFILLFINERFACIFVVQPETGRVDVDEALVSVTFARTPIMSTYLLAFVVGEYDYVEDKDSDGVLIRVYTPVGKSEQGAFALEVRASSYLMLLRYRMKMYMEFNLATWLRLVKFTVLNVSKILIFELFRISYH